MEVGWIKLHRSILQWQWITSPNHFLTFMTILIRANFKQTQWRTEIINAGQLLTGRKQLSSWTGLSEMQIRRILNDLEYSGEITINKTNKYSIISITKWDLYQHDQPTSNQQVTNKEPTSNQQVTTSKNAKKVKKDKNILSNDNINMHDDLFEKFWEIYPKRIGPNPKARAKKHFLKLIKKHDPEMIINKAALLSNSLAGEVSQYTPMASTWLSEERFLDEILTESEIQSEHDDLMARRLAFFENIQKECELYEKGILNGN